ncbi:MAG: type IV pilus assembly protein PilM [Lachnospiraceae bacterium]|nr:type IV pilus assembly protein PilM [Lachnospiraceae bacterium]
MAKSNKVLSIDITNESITIIELTASAKKQTMIHNIIIFETPEDSYEDGAIKEPEKIAEAISQQLAARGINNKNAIFVLSSTKIVNREVMIPFVPEKKIRGIINSNSSEYFPVNIEDYVVSHSVLETVTDEENNKQLRVLAVAAPEHMVKSYYDLGQMCGLNVVALDYIGNAMLQLIKTQTNQNTTTMVIQLGSESTVLNIVQGENLLLQRTVPYGTNSVVNVVMDDKGVDATTAMTLLQNDRLITVDFDDNEVTGAFRYLINNIGRVMDFYASKNPDKPIEDVFLTGDGALIRGIDGLFKVQLNVSTRIMDTLYNIKFDPSIDLKVYNPVYLVTPIGAAFAPMGFALADIGAQTAAKKEGSIAPFVALVAIAAIGAAGMAFYSINKKNDVTEKKEQLEADIARVSDIEEIINQYNEAEAKYNDIESMYYSTYILNENARQFISELEKKMPSEITISSFSTSDAGVTLPCTSTSYDAIADFIMQLKTIDCVDNAYVASISKAVDEAGQETFTFSVSVEYVPMMEDPAAATEDGADATTDTETTDETTEAE